MPIHKKITSRVRKTAKSVMKKIDDRLMGGAKNRAILEERFKNKHLKADEKKQRTVKKSIKKKAVKPSVRKPMRRIKKSKKRLT